MIIGVALLLDMEVDKKRGEEECEEKQR